MGSCQSKSSVAKPEVDLLSGTGGATSKTPATTVGLDDEENAGDECPICLEPNKAPYFLVCGHWLCPEHIPKIQKCPLCRHNLKNFNECDLQWLEGNDSLSGVWSSNSGSSMESSHSRIEEMETELDSDRVSSIGSGIGSSRSSDDSDWSYETQVVDLDSVGRRTLYEREVVDLESGESLTLDDLEYYRQVLDMEIISLESMGDRSSNELADPPGIAPWYRGTLDGQGLTTEAEDTVSVERQATILDQQAEIAHASVVSTSEDESFSGSPTERSTSLASECLMSSL